MSGIRDLWGRPTIPPASLLHALAPDTLARVQVAAGLGACIHPSRKVPGLVVAAEASRMLGARFTNDARFLMIGCAGLRGDLPWEMIARRMPDPMRQAEMRRRWAGHVLNRVPEIEARMHLIVEGGE